jgi:hypothetical protein
VRLGYGQLVKRFWPLARRYGLDVLIVVAAAESALEVAFRNDPEAPTTTLWFAVPAIALVPLTLLWRRRFPFAAPAALWLLAAALSFVDGRLVVFSVGTYAAGLAAALLLGSVRDDRQARVGLAIVLGAALVIVYNDPTRSSGEYVFIPVLFAIAWLAGFALHERAQQAEAAEERASAAERERDAAARIAVAEERARIGRELHDIVAHAMSVMVLQVGAVRHKLPESRAEEREALEESSAPAVPRSPRCGACSVRCDATTRSSSCRRSRGSTRSSRCSTRCAARACRSSCTWRATRCRSHARSTCPPTGSSRRA